jgi:hypothetical protein
MATAPARVIEVATDAQWDAMAFDERWTDGLPVLAPTKERVHSILNYLGRDPQEEIGDIPPAQGIATIEQIAINCSMAGCLPEYVPIVIQGIKCMLDPRFNLNGVQCTTNPCAPLLIASGAIVKEIGFNCRENVFGGGSRVNATIGRAIRLVLWNLGRAYPGETDMASLGHPGKFSFCVADNREDSPWKPFHTAYGLAPEASAVTMFAADPPHAYYIPGDAERIMKMLTQSLPQLGLLAFHSAGEILITIAPKPANMLASGGWTTSRIKQHLFENARWNLGELRRMGVLNETDHVQTYWGGVADPPDLDRLKDDETLPLVQRPEDIHILVTGGPGQWWIAVLPGWGSYGGFLICQELENWAGGTS